MRANQFLTPKNEIPISNTLIKIIDKKKILDDVIYHIREDGIVIEGNHTKLTFEYLPWNVFEGYTTNKTLFNSYGKGINFSNSDKLIGLRLMKKHEINISNGSNRTWKYIPSYNENEKIKTIEIIKSKLKEYNGNLSPAIYTKKEIEDKQIKRKKELIPRLIYLTLTIIILIYYYLIK